MRIKFTIAMLIGCLFMIGGPAAFGAAPNESATFEMTSGGDGSLVVVIAARSTSDVYAYELKLTFDARRLKLEKAEAPPDGLLVDPLVDGDRIRVAYTLIGPKQGMKGDMTLATLRFKRLAPGPAELVLQEVKLVDASIKSTLFKPALKMKLTEASGLIDIKGHWAESSVLAAVKRGIVTGYEDGTFRPERPVTRAEFAAMLTRALGLQGGQAGQEGQEGQAAQTAFADASRIPAWAAASIAAMAEAGIIQGYDDGTFRADRQIVRAEMTAMLTRAAGLKRAPEQAQEEPALPAFADSDQIPNWARASVAAAVEAGIVRGKTGNRFAAADIATRAEAVAAIMNLLHWQEK